MSRLTSVFYVVLMVLPIAACSAADSAASAGCDVYVQETRAACLDMIRRGLDVSCNKHIIAIETAMTQANGSLFDVGDSQTNQAVADSVCSSYLGDLREAREAQNASMQPEGKAGTQCVALAERFDTRCLSTLGKQPLSSACRGVARTFTMGGAASRLPREQLCTIAGMQLPKR